MALFAKISDIHANEPALLRAMNVIRYERGIPRENVRCLGDIVGYGPNVNECVDLIKSFEIPTLTGNHDQAVVDPFFDLKDFNGAAETAVHYARENLSDRNKEYLSTRPYTFPPEIDSRYGFECVHGSLVKPEEFKYVEAQVRSVKAREVFAVMTQPVLFIGHSHVPDILKENPGNVFDGYDRIDITEKPYQLEPGVRYIINVGSVGQPRTSTPSDSNTRDPRACFVIYDTEKHTVEFVRVNYKIEKIQKALREAYWIKIAELNEELEKQGRKKLPEKIAGIPLETVGDFLAERLEKGI